MLRRSGPGPVGLRERRGRARGGERRGRGASPARDSRALLKRAWAPRGSTMKPGLLLLLAALPALPALPGPAAGQRLLGEPWPGLRPEFGPAPATVPLSPGSPRWE